MIRRGGWGGVYGFHFFDSQYSHQWGNIGAVCHVIKNCSASNLLQTFLYVTVEQISAVLYDKNQIYRLYGGEAWIFVCDNLHVPILHCIFKKKWKFAVAVTTCLGVLQGLASLTRPVCMAIEGSDLESLVRLVDVLKGEKLVEIGAFLQTLFRNQVRIWDCCLENDRVVVVVFTLATFASCVAF